MPSNLFHFTLHRRETDLRRSAVSSFDEGEQHHPRVWEQKVNTSNLTHFVRIHLPSGSYSRWTFIESNKPILRTTRTPFAKQKTPKNPYERAEENNRCEAAESHQISSGVTTDVIWPPVVKDTVEITQQSPSSSYSTPQRPITAPSFSPTPPFCCMPSLWELGKGQKV